MDVGSGRADTLILAMPASASGESGAGARPGRCRACGARTGAGDRFCRSCGAERPRAKPPRAEPGPRTARRRLAAIAAAVILGLVAGLVVVIVVHRDDRGRAPAAQSTGSSATAIDPVESLRAHFDLLEQGRYPTAAEDLTPQLLDSLGGETIWISERIADLLIDAQLDARVVDETDRTATVRVDSLRTESLSRGCTDFSGTYSMVRSGDRWLISSADLVESPC